MLEFLIVLLIGLAWVGHACICTAVLNNLYGRRLPKTVLKPVRYLTGLAILAFPLLLAGIPNIDYWNSVEQRGQDPVNGWLGRGLLAYCVGCLYFGFVFPVVTLKRYLRKPPACV